MRIHRTIAVALAASASFAAYSEAFTSSTPSIRSVAAVASPPSFALFSTIDSEEQQAAAVAPAQPCDMPSDVEEEILNNALALRNAALTNARGERIVLGDLLQENTSNVVVFLRHMG